jgi:tetratricopeptide (TPR) repeat protein
MGGYASLHFRNAFQAKAAIVISPQVLALSRAGDFDTRWEQEQKKVKPLFDEESNLREQKSPAIVFFDKLHELDETHINKLKSLSNSKNCYLNVAYGNHNCARLLVQAGVLKPFITEYIRNCKLNQVDLEIDCANAFMYDSKAFFTYFREALKKGLSKKVVLLEHVFNLYLLKQEHFDFEECYLVAEILEYRGLEKEAIKFSRKSLNKYPSESRIPDYMFRKHLRVLKRFRTGSEKLRKFITVNEPDHADALLKLL